jgi:hypothetical protein
MAEMTYREPKAKDIGKIIEVSDYPDGHPSCNWQSVRLLDVRNGLFVHDKDGRFQASKEVRVSHRPPILMHEYFWEYARIKADG